MTTTALIVAAGTGQRAGQGTPKQYVMLSGKPLLTHTLEKFVNHPMIDHVLVVIAPGQEDMFTKATAAFPDALEFCMGSDTRQKSVFAGLRHIAQTKKSPENVLIHDAARPFVSSNLIETVVCCLDAHRAVLPAVAVSDTIKRISGNKNAETLNRSELVAAQTPQGFRFADILAAHTKVDSQSDKTFTDDASIAEEAGMDVIIVAGETANHKITTSQDLEKAAVSMKHPSPAIPDIRIGDGFDVHKFGPGDHLMLCGIKIPFDKSLIGHSDADVGLHALTDALLGAIADGDIGTHFPPGDPQWRGQSSDMFLAHACDLVRQKGGTILNMDITLICEQPKIGPVKEQMRKRLAEITKTDHSRISVKATTTEGLGFTGRAEGIAARAAVCVFLNPDPETHP